MTKKLLARLGGGVLVYFLVSVAAHWLINSMPGDPFLNEKESDPRVAELQRKIYGEPPANSDERESFGWKLSNALQYSIKAFQWNFGYSISHQHWTATDLLADGILVTLRVGLTAALAGTALGILLAVLIVRRNPSPLMSFAGLSVALFISIPVFVVATLLYGAYSAAGLDSSWRYLLGAVSLALPLCAAIYFFTAQLIRREIGAWYVRAAIAKGVSERQAVVGHILPVVAPEIINFLGPSFAALITGSFVVETVFNIPGSGKYLVLSLMNRDYPLFMASLSMYTMVLICFNIISDILHLAIDPRVRHDVQ